MKLLTNKNLADAKANLTNTEFMQNKYIYYKTQNPDFNIYHIFKIESVKANYPLQYNVNKYYYMCVPKSNDMRCFVYDNNKTIDIKYNAELYELSYDEFINTYRTFVKCEGKFPNEIPSKIIQNI